MTNQNPINPNPPRPRLISNQDFRALCELAFFDRETSLPVAIGEIVNTSPRSVERWLAKDEKIPAPKDVIEKCLEIAIKKVSTQAELIQSISKAIK